MNNLWKRIGKRDYCTEENILMWLKEGSVETKQLAMNGLYLKLLPELTKWVSSRGGTDVDGHDALTDALLAFFMQYYGGKYKEQGKVLNYVFTIAKNKYFDEARKKQRHDEPILGEPTGSDSSLPEPEPDPYPDVEKCLGSIGEKCKERLQRYYFFGQSHKEIAQAMGDSNEDVSKTMKQKCLGKLRKCVFNTQKMDESL